MLLLLLYELLLLYVLLLLLYELLLLFVLLPCFLAACLAGCLPTACGPGIVNNLSYGLSHVLVGVAAD